MPFGLRFAKEDKKPVSRDSAKSVVTLDIVPEKQPEKPVGKPVFTGNDEIEAELDEAENRQDSLSHEFLPVRVSSFDDLIEKHGIERGSTILISGGCGTGKTTFCCQSLYNGILNGEKAVYITFEESPEKIKRHMHVNYGWDLEKLEKENKLAILKLNPFKIARSVEASLAQQRKALLIKVEQISLPFMPDRIVVDSLSALSIAFMGNTENYRYYVRHMFEILDHYNSINFVVSETEQDPGIYSRTGMEEFLADGVIVLYNIKVGRSRERALEILKLRCSNHIKELVPYQLAKGGVTIFRGSEVEKQLKELSGIDSFSLKTKKS